MKIYTFMSQKIGKKFKLVFWTVWLVFSLWVTYHYKTGNGDMK